MPIPSPNHPSTEPPSQPAAILPLSYPNRPATQPPCPHPPGSIPIGALQHISWPDNGTWDDKLALGKQALSVNGCMFEVDGCAELSVKLP